MSQDRRDARVMNAIGGIWSGIGGDPRALDRVETTGADPVLPSTFAVGTAAAATVAATTLAAAELWRLRGGPADADVRVDVRESAVAFRSERYLRVNGAAQLALDELTGDYRTRDGWVRLHCNYPNHRTAALAVLGVSPDRVATELSTLDATKVEEAVHAAGGAAAALRSPAQWREHPQAMAVARLPLVELTDLGGGGRTLRASRRPLEGARVLDLTRVIAGPVAGRTLAAHGAQVLRVGADHLPLVPSLIIDTGFGKRFCHVDLRTEPGHSTLRGLIADADVLLQAYRPGALQRIGFGPAECASIRPGLVYVDICAWGQAGPWRDRRGFDSLVQMACGIADEGRAAFADGPPRPLPAQVLDHATGFLAALGAIEGLRRRHEDGGSWHVRLSLARTAAWLDSLGRVPEGQSAAEPTVDDLLHETRTPFGIVTHVRPPGWIDGAPPRWDSPPHQPGADPPAWEAPRM
jgi:hypothetical protein